MKRHALLIRLHRNQVDEKRRIVGDLERLRENLLAQRRALEDEVRDEQKAAGADFQAGSIYGAYAAFVVGRRAKLEQSIAEIDQRIVEAKDDVLEAFRTLKKHEVAQETRQRRDHLAAEKREQGRLDELALNAYRRRQAS